MRSASVSLVGPGVVEMRFEDLVVPLRFRHASVIEILHGIEKKRDLYETQEDYEYDLFPYEVAHEMLCQQSNIELGFI